MEKKTRCDYKCYVTDNMDAWNIFDEKYNCRVPYSIEFKNNCGGVYYVPLSGNKIRLK